MSCLSVNFAESFAPERLYLMKMLQFISHNSKSVSKEKISEKTGIPTGKSSGKVVPTIRYLKGMGLIEPEGNWYHLTDFGQTVLKNDIQFSERITQVACHVNICDAEEGGTLYNQIFSTIAVDKPYDRKSFGKEYCNSQPPITALLGMYLLPGAFNSSRILVSQDDSIVFNSVPINFEMMPVFGALIVHLFNQYFNSKEQVSIQEFVETTCINRFLGWKMNDVMVVFNQLSSLGLIKLYAHLQPVVFSPIKDESKCWKSIYDNLI